MLTLAFDSGTTTAVFDRTRDALLHNDVYPGMDALRLCLRRTRARMDAEQWAAFGSEARRHPLHDLLLESPFTHRAFSKPRGYAGDAVLMDLIYGGATAGPALSPLGGMLYGYEFDSPCFQSVRSRRAILAREIDDVAAARAGARVLSVACGHLREIEWSRAARDGRAAITALDQDAESLALVQQEYGRFGVTTVPGTIGDVLRRARRFRDLDLVYAAGLFDYLQRDLARALAEAMFRMLTPGGRLLLANFTPDTRDAAFMEAFMDWQLVYRDEQQMRALIDAIPSFEMEYVDQFRDANANITYLRAVRQ
jgi:extracellular factor (EF) 3-hydroxypalmitic acid methyl ester biosynthesis protein